MSKTVCDRVIECFDLLSPDDVTPQSRLLEDLHLDSLNAVELSMELEEEFDISIPDVQIESIASAGTIKTVQDVADYIQKRLDEAATQAPKGD